MIAQDVRFQPEA